MKMAWNKLMFVFILVAASPLNPQEAVGDLLSPLSPLLSPVLNGLCDAVECGRGECHVSLSRTFGFACQCNPGWSQFHIGDHFRFLPCVIPNCSINYSCTNVSVSPAPAASPTNLSLFDPCKWAYCGGGKCSQISTYEHKCVCNEGYSNIFNASAFPCYKDCTDFFHITRGINAMDRL
ncbi:slit homolog 2 protein-like isoform X2 [Asparagus officinalis]|uniref:slit homolog 2 protein-like isoform X2 n=1 Tax=Asparagus officinalis TaxID=4686 RepID=UPI00098DEB25|nr:slit homolog 2 protein-like isoform X2 [Asparagus officinalis]